MYPLAQRAFNEFGTEITDVLMFNEHDMFVYLTDKKNGTFIPIPSTAEVRTDSGTDDKQGLPTMIGAFRVGSLLDVPKNGRYPRIAALVTNESTGEKLVCKFVPKTALDDIEVVNSLGEEVRCLASLSHPNIVSFKRREDLASHVVLVFDPWFGANMNTHIMNNGLFALTTLS